MEGYPHHHYPHARKDSLDFAHPHQRMHEGHQHHHHDNYYPTYEEGGAQEPPMKRPKLLDIQQAGNLMANSSQGTLMPKKSTNYTNSEGNYAQ